MKILNMIKNIGSFIFIRIYQYIHSDGHGFKYIIGSFDNIESMKLVIYSIYSFMFFIYFIIIFLIFICFI